MIILIDDDQLVLDTLKDVLQMEGFALETFSNASEALTFLEQCEADLIIVDVIMPEMSGFDFKREYFRRFPNRTTPLIFLSSLGAKDNIIRGLELGADDFIVKDTHPDILTAKIKSHLALKNRYSNRIYQGRIEQFPFSRVLQFCESKGLTGNVEITSDEGRMLFSFEAGHFQDIEDTDNIEKALDLTSGSFTITSMSVPFDDIDRELGCFHKRCSPPVLAQSMKNQVQGRLSAITYHGAVYQIQTEFFPSPEHTIATIVVCEGQVVISERNTLQNVDSAAVQRILDNQHRNVEQRVRTEYGQETDDSVTLPAEASFDVLLEQGFAFLKQNDCKRAITCWKRALQIRPSDPIAQFNLKIAQKKLAQNFPTR